MLMGKSILNFHKIITNIFPFHKSLIVTIVDGNRYTHTQKIYYTFLLCSKQEHVTNRQTFICFRTAYSKRYINELCNLKILQKNIFRFMAFPCCWQLGRFFFDLVPYYLVYRLLLDVAQGCSERTALQYAAADFACALASNSDALSFDCALA